MLNKMYKSLVSGRNDLFTKTGYKAREHVPYQQLLSMWKNSLSCGALWIITECHKLVSPPIYVHRLAVVGQADDFL